MLLMSAIQSLRTRFSFLLQQKNALSLCLGAISNRQCDSTFAEIALKRFSFLPQQKNALSLCLGAISNRQCDSTFAEIALRARSLIFVCGAILFLIVTPFAHSQRNINKGTLKIEKGTTLYFGDGLIQDDSSNQTINNGRLFIDDLVPSEAILSFKNGVIRQHNPLGSSGGGISSDPSVIFPDYHTIFAPQARVRAASAEGVPFDYESLIDGAVRRQIGDDFFEITLPLGDSEGDEIYRGLLQISGSPGGNGGGLGVSGVVDAEYFWDNPIVRFGTKYGSGIRAVSKREYWKISSDAAVRIAPHFETSSGIRDLLKEMAGASAGHLTLAGWDGKQWVDLQAVLVNNDQFPQLTNADIDIVYDSNGFALVRTLSAMTDLGDFEAITFAVREEGFSGLLGVAKQVVDIEYDPSVSGRALITVDYVIENFDGKNAANSIQLYDDFARYKTGELVSISSVTPPSDPPQAAVLMNSVSSLNMPLGATAQNSEIAQNTDFVGLKVNPDYNPSDINSSMLASDNDMASGSVGKVRLTIASNSEEALSLPTQAVVTSVMADGSISQDVSVDGPDPDPNGDNNPDEQSVTMIDLVYPNSNTNGYFVTIEKVALAPSVSVGQPLGFVIVARNETDLDLTVDIIDFLPAGFSYEEGTGLVANPSDSAAQQIDPVLVGHNAIWANVLLKANSEAKFQLVTIPGIGLSDGEYINRSCARASVGMEEGCISDVASSLSQASFTVLSSNPFECSTVLGNVFYDINTNGIRDEGEVGVPGVRLGSPEGFFVYPDNNGRFTVPCSTSPVMVSGGNFVLKLDESTLPIGYSVLTENPRQIRVTPSKAAMVNFAVTQRCAIDLELSEDAFIRDGLQLASEWARYFDDIFTTLSINDNAQCTLNTRLIACGRDNLELNTKRSSALGKFLTTQWERRGNRALSMDVELVNKIGVSCMKPPSALPPNTREDTGDGFDVVEGPKNNVNSILVPQGMINTLPAGSVKIDPTQLSAGYGAGRVKIPSGYDIYRTPMGNLVLIPSRFTAGYSVPQVGYDTSDIPAGSVIVDNPKDSQLEDYKMYKLPNGRWLAVRSNLLR